jgi:phage gp46-like protein
MSLDTAILTVAINGQVTTLDRASEDQLVRAVLISLFTWRRANKDDALPGERRMGWWGDSYATVTDDKIGSRLWLLARSKLVPDTIARAKEYAEEALSWMVEDGVAARVVVIAERYGAEGLALNTQIYRNDGRALLDLRFSNVWEFLNV